MIHIYKNKKRKYYYIEIFACIIVLILFLFFIKGLFNAEKAHLKDETIIRETEKSEIMNSCDGNHTSQVPITSSTIFSDGMHVFLEQDINSPLEIKANNITLCLNGHDINANNLKFTYTLTISGTNFVLKDCGKNVRYYKIDPSTKLLNFDNATESDNEGSITGGAIRGGYSKGITATKINAQLLGGNVVGNTGGITLKGCGNVQIRNMNIIGNGNTHSGGGVSIEALEDATTNVTIDNTTIKYNNASYGGGVRISNAIWNDNSRSNIVITDSIITENNALKMGGGIESFCSMLNLNRVVISKNIAGEFGGGMEIYGGKTTFSDTSITENSINDGELFTGGGVYCYSVATLSFRGNVNIDQNNKNGQNNNLFLNTKTNFDKSDILSPGSKISMSFSNKNPLVTESLENINSQNEPYFLSDDPNKIIAESTTGGLLYKDKPSITFYDNFSAGSQSQMFDPNVPITLKSNLFMREGYTFLGWSTSASSQEVTYKNGQNNVTLMEDTALYAVWHENHNGLEFTEVYNNLDMISGTGGNYVLIGKFQDTLYLNSGVTNLCLKELSSIRKIQLNGTAELVIHDCSNNAGIFYFIKVSSEQSTLTINGGSVYEITVDTAKDVYINGGNIGRITAVTKNFQNSAPFKIYISGKTKFEEFYVNERGIVITTTYDALGNIISGATIVLNNGKTGDKKINYKGNSIELKLNYAEGLAVPLYGQVVVEDVLETQKNLIKLVDIQGYGLNYKLSFVGKNLVITKKQIDLFDDEIKFYRNNLWDTFRSPAYPSRNRPFYLYDLSAPYDANMNPIDFTNQKYVKFEKHPFYTTIADLTESDKNRILNSLKYSTYSNERAILNGLIVSEVLYNNDGTRNRDLAKIGLIWSLGEQGFLYTSLDSDGAFPHSGGIGTYVTFKAHNNGDNIIDNTPKNDPLSKDDFDSNGDGVGLIEIPTLPDVMPPADSDIIISYMGKVIDGDGIPLSNVNVRIEYGEKSFTALTDASGYFIISEIFLEAFKESAKVTLNYSNEGITYGTKTYINMPILIQDFVTYVYPLTQSSEDGIVQALPHKLELVDFLESTCDKFGNLAHYIFSDNSCSCGKIFGDSLGLNEIHVEDIMISKIPHTEEEIPGVEASCTETGLTAGLKCSVCQQVVTEQIIIEKIAHTEEEIPGVEASCTETGLTAGSKCSVCQQVITEQILIEKIAHTEEEILGVEASCTETGLTAGSKCSVCKQVITEQIIIEKIAHTEEEIPGLEASCTETGLTTGLKCSVCQQVITEQTITEKIAHIEEEIPGIEATCTKTGLTDGLKCSVCNQVITEQTLLPILTHSYDNGEVTKQPTTEIEGEKSYLCRVCGHIKIETIPKLSVVDEEEINLLWLIILLALINVLEIILIVLISIKKQKNNQKKAEKLNSYWALAFVLYFSQVVSGHLVLSVLLTMTALLQGLLIIFLWKNYKKNQETSAIESI